MSTLSLAILIIEGNLVYLRGTEMPGLPQVHAVARFIDLGPCLLQALLFEMPRELDQLLPQPAVGHPEVEPPEAGDEALIQALLLSLPLPVLLLEGRIQVRHDEGRRKVLHRSRHARPLVQLVHGTDDGPALLEAARVTLPSAAVSCTLMVVESPMPSPTAAGVAGVPA